MDLRPALALLLAGSTLAACSTGLDSGRTLTPEQQADFSDQMIRPDPLADSQIPPATEGGLN